jgi:hypothetical protein
MRHYINKLKEKPDHHKERIAVVASGITVVFIFMVWVATFAIRFPVFSSINKPQQAALETTDISSTDQVAGAASPINSLKENISGGYENMKKVLGANPLKSNSNNDTTTSEDQRSPAPDTSSSYTSNGVEITDTN